MSRSAAARLMSTEDSAKGFDPSKAGARAGTQDNDETPDKAGGASASGRGADEHRVEGLDTNANLTERVEAIETDQEEIREGQQELRDGLKKIRLKNRKQVVKFMKVVNNLEKTISDKTSEIKDAIFDLKESVIEDRSASERSDNDLNETVTENRSASERSDNDPGKRFNNLDKTVNEMKDEIEAIFTKLGNDLMKEFRKQHTTMIVVYVGTYMGMLALVAFLIWTKT